MILVVFRMARWTVDKLWPRLTTYYEVWTSHAANCARPLAERFVLKIFWRKDPLRWLRHMAMAMGMAMGHT